MRIENNQIIDKRKVGRLLEVYKKNSNVCIEEIRYIPVNKKDLIIRGKKQREQILSEHGYNSHDYYFIEEGDIFEVKVMSVDIFEKYAKSTQVIQFK